MKKITKSVMKSIFIVNLGFCIQFSNAQVGIGTTSPNASSILDVVSTNKGLLMPRVALSSTTSPSPLLSHVAGMQVYNTATVSDVVSAQYYNNGTKWIRLGEAPIKNYTFLRTSDNLPSDVVGDNNVSAYRTGHTALGNVQLDPEAGYPSASGTRLASSVLNVYENFNTANGYNTKENIGIASSIILNMPAGNTHLFSKAIVSNVIIPPGNTLPYNTINSANLRAYNFGSGTLNQVIATINTCVNSGSGAVNDATGARTAVSHTGTGTLGALKGELVTVTALAGAGQVTDAYGLTVDTGNWNGTNATNYYGLFLFPGKGTNNYAIYTNDGYIRLGGLPIYNSEAAAAAAGLPQNVLYKTTTGEMRVKL